MALDDQFLQRKVPELLSKNGLPPEADLVKGYLRINASCARRRRSGCARSRPLGSQAPVGRTVPPPVEFGPMSAFADRRTYTYGGQPIDHKTHLGYDLASVLRAPVEAAQNGTVVFAGDLASTAVRRDRPRTRSLFALRTPELDHGATGAKVRTGEHVGQSGENRPRGGDHLHFSVMLDGVHVDPREWWDPKWLKDHVNPRSQCSPSRGSHACGRRGCRRKVTRWRNPI